MNNPQIKIIPFDTYLAFIKNSVGSLLFRNLYANVDDKKTDITENGNLSCAVFVSSILFLFKLINDTHANVGSTIKDLLNSNWIEIKEPKLGCVLVWEEKDFGTGGQHKHIGFFIGEEKAVSNNSQYGYPTEHDWKEYDGRNIELILWHPKLA
jgi:hypothetical protein